MRLSFSPLAKDLLRVKIKTKNGIKAEEVNYNNVIFTFSNSVTKQMVYLQIHVNWSWL